MKSSGRSQSVSRRRFLAAAGGAAMASIASARLMGQTAGGSGTKLAAGSPGGRRKNVLFIIVDDLRPQLKCYGMKQMLTPNIDRLASEGVLFERAYCQQAVCAPSRASVLSGCRPDTTKIYDLDHPLRKMMPDVLTLPQHFKQQGYVTMSLGKVYHHADDDLQAWTDKPWRAPDGYPGYRLDENRETMEKLREKAPPGKRMNVRAGPTEAADVVDNVYPDGAAADEAISLFASNRDKPFFMALGFIRPHLPFACPKKYWDLYDPANIDLADNPYKPKDCPDLALTNWAELRSYVGIPKTGPLSDEEARKLIHGYYACVSYTDAQIGRVLDGLEKAGLRDDTTVVLWGDHGWQLGEHGLWCKHTNFETSTHAPLIISGVTNGGDFARGRTSDALVEFVDIYPTVCELSGLALPGHLEGTSMAPLLKDPNRAWKTAAFSQYPRGAVMGHSVRTDRYRFTSWAEPGHPPVAMELYDHKEDPAENTNLAGRPEMAETVKQMSATLAAGWKAARPG